MDSGGNDLPYLLSTNLDSAFASLVAEYGPQLYAFALRMTANTIDTEDILQIMFERAYLALSDYSTERIRTLKIRPWLYKITLNVARNYISRTRLQDVSLDLSLEEGMLDFEDIEYNRPEIAFEVTERREELKALVGSLAPCYRDAIQLCFFSDMTYQETAKQLNKSVGTIKFYVHRGIALLRTMLERQKE